MPRLTTRAVIGIGSFVGFLIVVWLANTSTDPSHPHKTNSKPSTSLRCHRWARSLKTGLTPYISNDKTVIITGAAGFIGSHITRYCVNRLRMTVIAVDDLSSGYEANIPVSSKVTFVRGDLKNATFVWSLFRGRKIDYVYHLAGYPSRRLSHFVRSYIYRNNLLASVNLINAAVKAGVKCFVFTSSVAVYGSSELVVSESSIPHPQDSYGIAKLSTELELRATKRVHDLEYVILRLHNVFGPNQNVVDPYRNVISIFMGQIMRDTPITVLGDGTQKMSFTYIDDIVSLVARCPLYPAARSHTFNLGSDNVIDINHVVEVVKSVMKRPNHPVKHVPAQNEGKLAGIDHSKANCFFKQTPRMEFEVGVSSMADWFRAVGAERLKRSRLAALKVETKKNIVSLWLNEDVSEVDEVDHLARLVA